MSWRQPIPSLNWFDLDDPASPALDELAARFKLHELQIEDCRHRPQRAKVEEHHHYIFSVFKALHGSSATVFDDLDVFLGKDFIVTVHGGRRDLIERVEKRAHEQRARRFDKLFYFIADAVVDEYMPMLDRISDDITKIEAEVLRRPEPPALRTIFRLRRRLIEFRRISAGMREVMNALIRQQRGVCGDDLDPYFRDVYDHLVRTVDLIESYRELLTGALDIYLSAVANRTNQVMKVLTIYGTVALPLVIITGFFGMNLHLPWENDPWGIWYASGVMGLSGLLVLFYMRRKGVF
jgi:magnesium transporter